MGFNATGFEELSRQLSDLGEEFEEKVERSGSTTGRNPESGKFITIEDAIIGAINDTMDDAVIPQAETDARRYLPSNDDPRIGHESRGFRGDTYRHIVYSSNDLVKYHEFGTGKHGRTGSKYVITPDKKDSLHFFWEKIGEHVSFRAVRHPGVEGKHFTEQALRRNTREFERNLSKRFNEMNF